jgi:hypothetical protein
METIEHFGNEPLRVGNNSFEASNKRGGELQARTALYCKCWNGRGASKRHGPPTELDIADPGYGTLVYEHISLTKRISPSCRS